MGASHRWPSSKEYVCQCRRCRFNPWSRKIPHAAEQLSPSATTTEPGLWSPETTTAKALVPQSLRSTIRGATTTRSRCIATRDYLPLATTGKKQQRPRIAENKETIKRKPPTQPAFCITCVHRGASVPLLEFLGRPPPLPFPNTGPCYNTSFVHI